MQISAIMNIHELALNRSRRNTEDIYNRRRNHTKNGNSIEKNADDTGRLEMSENDGQVPSSVGRETDKITPTGKYFDIVT